MPHEGDRPVEQHGDAVLEAGQCDEVDGEPEQPGHEAFHRLFSGVGSRIGWKESYDISLAGAAASRVFAAAGAGGVALTAWALDRSGMDRKLLASRLTNFYVLLYGVFVAALVVGGVALRTGVLHGPAPFALTVVPAIFGGVAIVVALIAAGLPADLGQRVASRLREHERVAKWVGRAADALATLAAGVRGALTLARAIRRSSGRSSGGPSISRCCGRASRHSARRLRAASS